MGHGNESCGFMTPARKWQAGLGVAAAAALLGLVAVSFIPSNEELAKRASARLETALGVPVRVGALQWRLFPSPRRVIEDVATRQTEPIALKMLMVYPRTAALWQLRLQVDRAELEGGVLPQLSLVELGAQALPAAEGQPQLSGAKDVLLARLVFHDVNWISRLGNHIVYAGDVGFDAGWRPRTAQVRRPGFTPATDLTLTRQGQEDRWGLGIRLGGGTADGEVHLHATDKGPMRLSGTLKPRDIEAVSALQAINHRTPTRTSPCAAPRCRALMWAKPSAVPARTLQAKPRSIQSRDNSIHARRHGGGLTQLKARSGALNLSDKARAVNHVFTRPCPDR
jgi:hypothetical protein